jgi:L-asparaginase II
MLLASQVMDAPSARYIDAAHPVQVLMRSTVADFAGLPAEAIPIAVDGCGVPAFFLSLYRAAFAYARLMATGEGEDAPGALERYLESASHVIESMTTFPQYVAGGWSMTTPLMQSFDGELLAKEGAEGFYAIGLSPALSRELTERLEVADDAAVAIALKIADGSMDRGRNPVILRTLQQLGIDIDTRAPLAPFRKTEITNVAGTIVGEVRAEFELEVL